MLLTACRERDKWSWISMRLTKLAVPALFTLACLAILAGCGPDSDADASGSDDDTLFQVSTISDLNEGRFDGLMSFDDLKEHGDFGLGTFDALDGEMIALDGEFYQVKVDGIAYEVDGDQRTPFSAVTHFDADHEADLDISLSCKDLEAEIDGLLAAEFERSDATPFALAVSGHFESVLTRSEAAQEQPYPSLSDALAGQVEFNLTDVDGTLVGFRLPQYMDGANPAGYHFHFITDDRQAGGHVLDCRTASVQVAIDDMHDWQVSLAD
jgi:acetolactate decarboxylase